MAFNEQTFSHHIKWWREKVRRYDEKSLSEEEFKRIVYSFFEFVIDALEYSVEKNQECDNKGQDYMDYPEIEWTEENKKTLLDLLNEEFIFKKGYPPVRRNQPDSSKREDHESGCGARNIVVTQ